MAHSPEGGGGGERLFGRASCLASAGRATLSGGTTFPHIRNISARRPEPVLAETSAED